MNAAPFTTHAVSSKDGTTIGYRQLGQGPGIVVLHGSMSSGYYHLELAEALSDAFTVYLLDRRGRGLSGAYQDGDGIQREVEDLEAVLTRTGAKNVFGVSVGAVIALQAALAVPAISRLALYEPLLFPDAATASAMMGRYDQQMAAGKVTAALSTAMKGAQMGSPIMNAMPHWLVLARVLLAQDHPARALALLERLLAAAAAQGRTGSRSQLGLGAAVVEAMFGLYAIGLIPGLLVGGVAGGPGRQASRAAGRACLVGDRRRGAYHRRARHRVAVRRTPDRGSGQRQRVQRGRRVDQGTVGTALPERAAWGGRAAGQRRDDAGLCSRPAGGGCHR